MAYQAVFEYDDDGDGDAQVRVGHFDPDRADWYDEATRFNGENTVSVNTGKQWAHEQLARTAGGVWVKHTWSQWRGVEKRWWFITPDEAREWLTRNEHDAEVMEDVTGGTMPEESAPPKYGRPKIGDGIKVALPDDTVAALDRLAKTADQTRAAYVRDIITRHIEEQQP